MGQWKWWHWGWLGWSRRNLQGFKRAEDVVQCNYHWITILCCGWLFTTSLIWYFVICFWWKAAVSHLKGMPSTNWHHKIIYDQWDSCKQKTLLKCLSGKKNASLLTFWLPIVKTKCGLVLEDKTGQSRLHFLPQIKIYSQKLNQAQGAYPEAARLGFKL